MATPFLHCWQADLTADGHAWAAAPAWLSATEQARQARLRTPILRQTYGRAHGFLRAVLAHYTGHEPAQLAFGTTQRDKPVLAPAALAAPVVHFNLSYSAGRALLAVSNHCPVGADLEPLTPLADADALVAQLFSGPEQAALHAAAAADWWPLFYLIWTRKEAYAKALGMGLALPFAGFSVLGPGGPGGPAWLAPAGMQLHSFAAGRGYQAAVAACTPHAALSVRHLNFLNEF